MVSSGLEYAVVTSFVDISVDGVAVHEAYERFFLLFGDGHELFVNALFPRSTSRPYVRKFLISRGSAYMRLPRSFEAAWLTGIILYCTSLMKSDHNS